MSEDPHTIQDVDAIFLKAIAHGNFDHVSIRDSTLKRWWHKNVQTISGRSQLVSWMKRVNDYCAQMRTETCVKLASDQHNCGANERRLRIYCRGQVYKHIVISNNSTAMIIVEE